jgi:GxxExxY protein
LEGIPIRIYGALLVRGGKVVKFNLFNLFNYDTCCFHVALVAAVAVNNLFTARFAYVRNERYGLIRNGKMKNISKQVEEVGANVVEAAFRVHRTLGPGLLESAYEVCLEHELKNMGCHVQRQVVLPVEYDGVQLDAGYRLDLLVDEAVIVELKAVSAMQDIFRAQMITYLRLSGKQLGYLINFNVKRLKDGLNRIVLT